MLHINISDFLTYCNTNGYSSRTIEVFSSKFNEFISHLNSLHITSYQEILYDHLLAFIIYGNPSVHVKKHRVWFLRQFFQYLKNNSVVKVNIASKLPYPKINQKEPEFLTFNELKTIIDYFLSSANSPVGIRNLIIVLFLVFPGLRISSILNINIQDIDLKTSSLLVTEKGNRKRIIFLPQILCFFLYPYIRDLDRDLGALFLSNRNKRISHRSIQHVFSEASLFMKDAKVSLKRFFAFAVKAGYLEKNPAEALPRVRIPKSDLNKPLKTKVLCALLKSFARTKWMGMRNFTIVSILWALGLRVNELLKMKRRDINLDYDPEHKIGTLLVHGKGGKERTLFIVDTLYDTFSRYLSLKKTPKRQGSLLFPGTKGKTIGGTRVRQLIMEAAEGIGITARVTPHVFRHTFATDMYNQGVPIEAIQEMMGHETLRETSVYIHISDELQAEVLKKISIKENVS